MLDIQFGKRSFTTQQKKSMGRWKVLGNIYHVQNGTVKLKQVLELSLFGWERALFVSQMMFYI